MRKEHPFNLLSSISLTINPVGIYHRISGIDMRRQVHNLKEKIESHKF